MNTYKIGFDGTNYLFKIKTSTYYATVIPVETENDAHQMEEILKRNGYVESGEE